MRSLHDFRAGKPIYYPDQAIYAEYACSRVGLAFEENDSGTGLLFSVASTDKSVAFGAGRCSFYPQNNATAASLASDKYFTSKLLERAGVQTLGGRYFFLHDRHRTHRPPGHERGDAFEYFARLDGAVFAKPLLGSHGDFAQIIEGDTSLSSYLDEVSKYYDSILIQPVFSGNEYRIFALDGEVLYSARKHPPSVLGDGTSTIRELINAYHAALISRGISSAPANPACSQTLDAVLARGERWTIPGRMNLAAGGTMALEAPPDAEAAYAQARQATKVLGLRLAAVDVFTDIDGDNGAIRVIEVNANPSIRFLEQSGRDDLIVKIWRHTFSVMSLLGV